jgi:hypothetical protein
MTMDAVSATIVLGGQAIILKYERSKEIYYFYVNIMNILNCFDGGIGTNMRKAACPLGGMDSSNPHLQRGQWLHHHDGGVCCVFLCCCGWTRDVTSSSYVKRYERITLR